MDTKKIRYWHLVAPHILQGLAWIPVRSLLAFFTHARTHGDEHLAHAKKLAKERNMGIIFACNHTSELDFAFPLMSLSPFSRFFPMFYVVRETRTYRHNAGFGWRRYLYGFPPFFLVWGAHAYIPDQQNYERALPFHTQLLKRGKSVCIFPEGKFKYSPATYSVRGGVTYLAEASNAIVLPVYIHGARGMNVKRFFRRKMRVTVSYKKPLTREALLDASVPVPQRYKESAERLMDVIHDTHKEHLKSSAILT